MWRCEKVCGGVVGKKILDGCVPLTTRVGDIGKNLFLAGEKMCVRFGRKKKKHIMQIKKKPARVVPKVRKK